MDGAVNETPPEWRPGNPGYARHLVLTQMRAAALAARATLEQIGHPAPDRVVARALWALALAADAHCQTWADDDAGALKG